MDAELTHDARCGTARRFPLVCRTRPRNPCVLLHPGGAGVDSRARAPTVDALARVLHVYTPEERAHGRTPDADGPVSHELMAHDTIMFIESAIGHPVYLMGYSDGAVIALTIALHRPDLVRRVVFVAGVFHHDEEVRWLPRRHASDLCPSGQRLPAVR